MQKVTVTDAFTSTSVNITNLTCLDKKTGISVKSVDSYRSSKHDYQMKDMLNLLEIKTNTKKILHAPSLKTFILKRFKKTVAFSKKKMYMLLRAWRRMAKSECEFVIDFDNLYFDDKNDVVYLNFDYTGCYPLKAI